jgi:HD-GYP domain-containing protein (c-di-GMP phosphodiesterase class II)
LRTENAENSEHNKYVSQTTAVSPQPESKSAAASARLAELVAALSLATDLGLGQPMEHELRACLLALRLGERLGMGSEERHDLFFVALLRWVGCTGHAHEVARWFDDEIAARGRSMTIELARPADAITEALRHAGEGRPPLARVMTIAALLAAGPRSLESDFQASCEVAQMLTERLGFGDGVRGALWFAFERWDGTGFPRRAAGEAIPRTMRVVQLAQDATAFCRLGGAPAAVDVVRRRSGAAYDPAIADMFCCDANALLARLDAAPAWEEVIAAEPVPHRLLHGDAFEEALVVMADFVDLKSPYTAGHSRGVAELASQAGRQMGLSAGEVTALRRAGLVHDLGRTGVPNGIWDKPGPLTGSEWERVRLHPYYTERMLARPESLTSIGAIAALHHERLDGSGYHRASRGPALPRLARVLASADAYQAMREPRRYRPALPVDRAAAELRGQARGGRLDADCVEAVLGAAGHQVHRRREGPAGLSAREVEVLRLLARGLPNRETARELSITEKTVAHHVQHIYDKIGVSTRGAASLFAMQHGLLPDLAGDNG